MPAPPAIWRLSGLDRDFLSAITLDAIPPGLQMQLGGPGNPKRRNNGTRHGSVDRGSVREDGPVSKFEPDPGGQEVEACLVHAGEGCFTRALLKFAEQRAPDPRHESDNSVHLTRILADHSARTVAGAAASPDTG
jgi:hypothetical protein